MSRLPTEAFSRHDETPDEEFYRTPRLVTHIDDRAIAAVTQLYREHFPPGGAILDLMSSWISHLPPEVTYRRVAGLGMNEVELKENLRIDTYVVQDLNVDPRLPFGDGEFDGVGCCVSIDYLTRPVEVLREVGRVLKVGSPLIVTFSNRCFPNKAVAVWLQLDDRGHVRLVEEYLQEAGNFENVRGLDRSPRRMFSDPLYAVIGESTGDHTRTTKREELRSMAKKEGTYTHPELREGLKEEIKASDKGGRSGQWSARKSQLLTKEYEKAGGGYKGEKTKDQKNLEKWTEEEWTTQEGDERARREDETARYLPKGAWEKLSPEERQATESKKRESSKKGEQYVENTRVAREARKEAAVPIASYDDLNVEEIKDELEGLSEDELKKVRSYEKKHKNRKTLLEQLDRKIGNAR